MNEREKIINEIYVHDGKVIDGNLNDYNVTEGTKRDIEIPDMKEPYFIAKEKLKDMLKGKTNEISKALGRGKHTTRHSQLHDLFGGLVADTPGFSKLEFYDIKEEEVPDCFVDFFELSSECKYRGCTHINEPKCKVKSEVENGNIIQSRYYNYKLILDEIKNQKIKYAPNCPKINPPI